MMTTKVPYIWKKTQALMVSAICLVSVVTTNALGAVKVKNISYSKQEQEIEANGMTKDEVIATLKKDIKAIDEQMAQCQKQKKGWTAATVIGGVGIVGTGIGALVQNNQIQNKKSELKSAQDELRSLE